MQIEICMAELKTAKDNLMRAKGDIQTLKGQVEFLESQLRTANVELDRLRRKLALIEEK